MHALVLALALSLSAQAGWQNKVKKLSDTEFDHYYALRAYLTDDQKKAYLKLKTEEERNQFLKDLGLWDRFYQYDPETRQQILDGKVQVGWTKDMIEMAWGVPFDKRRLAGRAAQRSELWIYRFEQQKDGSVLVWEPGSKTQYSAVRLFERELVLDDDRLVEMREKDAAF
ncbi:MAG: hypothetical protein D6798_01720 [Deltaproteobacteria bacterium]|nr:MAG: hypothetical protein D6798_01720 [Deltaproteobacteria bacterium]